MTTPARIDALLSLLEDEDDQISTVAMEQLLRSQNHAEEIIRNHQESSSRFLRTRIHQMGGILQLRRRRQEFIRRGTTGTLPLKKALEEINYQYNPRFNPAAASRRLRAMSAALAERMPTSAQVCTFMRDEGFACAGDGVLGAGAYLLENVLHERVGSPILLSAIAHILGRTTGWDSSIVLYRGKHCLMTNDGALIEPHKGWKLTHLSGDSKLHPCAERDLWLAVLTQLLLTAMFEGRLQAIHRLAAILTGLCDGDITDLPYPLGRTN